jgi:cytidyltransferase-like protein
MKKVFVSGCFDIIHGGHVDFLKRAKSFGDYLIVCFASDKILFNYKQRLPAMSEENKKFVLEHLNFVDKVYKSTNLDDCVFDFKDAFIKENADVLVVMDGDRSINKKRMFCEEVGAELITIPRSKLFSETSTSKIRKCITESINT